MNKKPLKIAIAGENDQDLLEYLHSSKLFAYDIETKGNEPKTAKIIGIAISCEEDDGWYIPLRLWDEESQDIKLISQAQMDFTLEVLDILKSKDLVMHNGVFDIVTTINDLNVDLTKAFLADTILMKHTIDEETLHGLDACVKQYEDMILLPGETTVRKKKSILEDNIHKNGGKTTQKLYEIYKADLDILAEYAIADVYLTLRLFYLFDEILEEQGRIEFFYDDEVMPLNIYGTIPMKLHGVPINVEYYENLKQELEDKIEDMKNEIYIYLQEDTKEFIENEIDSKVKLSRSGAFAKFALQYFNLPVPKTKAGKETLARAGLEKLAKQYSHFFIDWLIWKPEPKTIIGYTDEDSNEPIYGYEKEPIPEPVLSDKIIKELKLAYYESTLDEPLGRVFKVSSTKHLRWLIYDKYKFKKDTPREIKLTSSGLPSVDVEVLQEFVKENPENEAISTLLELRKEEKVLSTYVNGILERKVEDRIYPTMQQYGTTSGRYSCKNPNFQNLPSNDKRIKKGIQAPKGYKIVNADFASLEPRIFSWVTQDPGLLKVWNEGRDLYSYLAIQVISKVKGWLKVPAEATDNPKDDNYLKKLAPEVRDGSKTFSLSVPYGSNAYALHMKTGLPVHTCQVLINSYLEEVPGLADYMTTQEELAILEGEVRTQFGRVRHLPLAKEYYEEFGDNLRNKMNMCLLFGGETAEELYVEWKELREEIFEIKDKIKAKEIEKEVGKELVAEINEEMKDIKREIYQLGDEGGKIYSKFRNYMNLAKNAPIQMSAAHVANAALIKYAKLLKKHKIDGWIFMQIHDEIASIIREDQAEFAAELLAEAMSDNYITRQINIPIMGEPLIADTFDAAK